jgi:hypothetical protein
MKEEKAMSIKAIIGKSIMKVMSWSSDNTTPNDVFNSVRISAIIDELQKSGQIDKEEFECNVASRIYDLVNRMGDNYGRREGIERLGR